MDTMAIWRRFAKDERGTEAVEWAILIGLLVLGSLVFIAGMGNWVHATFSNLHNEAAGGSP
jgi:Flp pilus assembly pilin Flp